MFLLAFSACRPDLTGHSEVVDLRTLAVTLDPPEVAPGEASRVTALVADPTGNGRALDWVLSLCTPDPAGGCLEYNALLAAYPDPEEAGAEFAKCCLRMGTDTPVRGVLELTGAGNVVRTASSMLEGLDEATASEGVNAQLSLLVCEDGVCLSDETPTESPEGESAPSSDSLASLAESLPPDQSTLSLKRLRVSSKSEEIRNHNPTFSSLLINDTPYSPEEILLVTPGETLRLQPVLEAEGIEAYTYVNSAGETENRCESPYFAWYATSGEFEQDYTAPDGALCDGRPPEALLEAAVNTWTVPEPDPTGAGQDTLFVVAWDRRGGMSWIWLPVIYDEGSRAMADNTL